MYFGQRPPRLLRRNSERASDRMWMDDFTRM
jgi:hypothetical protein